MGIKAKRSQYGGWTPVASKTCADCVEVRRDNLIDEDGNMKGFLPRTLPWWERLEMGFTFTDPDFKHGSLSNQELDLEIRRT